MKQEAKKSYRHIFPMVCVGILIFLIAVLAIGVKYRISYVKSTAAESFSPDGEYQAVVYQVGAPDFPFGATHCQAVLKRDGEEIQKYNFRVYNDGGNVSAHNFEIRWNADCAEIVSSGEEQGKQLITIDFDGTVAAEWLESDWKEGSSAEVSLPEDTAETASSEYIESEEIYEGYCAVYDCFFAEEGYDFTVSYSAKGNSRIILKENEKIIEFLVYDRLSANQKCELYVLYRSKKAEDGSWSPSEAEILDIFAYEMFTKDVVSSGKTSWSSTANEKYYEITGEK